MIGSEILTSLGTSAGGGFLGAIIAYFGIKARIDSLERALGELVTDRECKARSGALSQRMDNSVDRFSRIDANIEIIRQMLMDRTFRNPGKEG